MCLCFKSSEYLECVGPFPWWNIFSSLSPRNWGMHLALSLWVSEVLFWQGNTYLHLSPHWKTHMKSFSPWLLWFMSWWFIGYSKVGSKLEFTWLKIPPIIAALRKDKETESRRNQYLSCKRCHITLPREKGSSMPVEWSDRSQGRCCGVCDSIGHWCDVWLNQEGMLLVFSFKWNNRKVCGNFLWQGHFDKNFNVNNK